MDLASHIALDEGRRDDALAIARSRRVDAQDLLGESLFLEALAAARDAEEVERIRWWLLRWSPRHDEGVVYSCGTRVSAYAVYAAVPALVLTRDFAPADMQYRMLREHLWDPDAGLYRDSCDLENSAAEDEPATASGNGAVAAGIARALRIGGDGVPPQVRGRWQENTRDLLDAAAQLADAGLAYAAFVGVADGWLEARCAQLARDWLAADPDGPFAPLARAAARAHP